MSRGVSLVKNIGLLTLGRFGTRALSVLLVPLYTSVLTTAEYGVYDLIGNAVGILVPLLTQDVVDAVLRFSIDGSGKSMPGVLAVGLKWLLLSLVPVSAILIANNLLGLFPSLCGIEPLILLLYATSALSGIAVCYARGLNRFADVAISSIICSAVTLGLNIAFLVVFGWGLPGYFLANIIGPLVQDIYLLIRAGLRGANPLRCECGLEGEMLAYSRPLVANSAAWWVNNASDRFVVTFFCGIDANGVYSVASKISNILFMFQAVFNQAWTISAVEEFDPEDRDGFFSGMYSMYNCAMVLLCSLLILVNIVIARLFFAGAFFEAWRYAPFLTVSVVFGASAGYVEGIFAAVKDTKTCAKTTTVGAVANVALNLLFVPIIGPLGAAIATEGCYCVTWALRMVALRRFINLRISIGRDVASYALLTLQGAFLLVLEPVNHHFMYLVQFIMFAIVVALQRSELTKVIHEICNRMTRGKQN